jgi:hypothetical protein
LEKVIVKGKNDRPFRASITAFSIGQSLAISIELDKIKLNAIL